MKEPRYGWIMVALGAFMTCIAVGAMFGAAAMVSSLGMAAGPAIGGWIFDSFGRYTWMYIYSGAIGLGAVAIALAFPPFPKAAGAASPAAA